MGEEMNNQLKILAVDDDPLIADLVKATLEGEGFLVSTANNGTETLEALASGEKFDIVLLDIMMPDMDGLAVYTKMQENPELKGTPVILLTAKAQVADVENARELGITDYIIKPFEPLELGDKIKEVLNRLKGEE